VVLFKECLEGEWDIAFKIVFSAYLFRTKIRDVREVHESSDHEVESEEHKCEQKVT